MDVFKVTSIRVLQLTMPQTNVYLSYILPQIRTYYTPWRMNYTLESIRIVD